MNKQNLDKYATLIIFVLVTAVTCFILLPVARSKADFYNELWGPAYLLMHGQSPYATASLQPELPAVWFPMSIGFLSVLGLFSEKIALQIWFFVNVVQLGILVWWMTGSHRSVFTTPLVAILVYFFPPTINHLMLGQFSISAMLCLLSAAYFAEKEYSWATAFFLALGISKPQLGILAVFGMSVFYFRQTGFKRVILFGLQVLIASVILSLPLFIAHSNWISDWIVSTRSNHYAWLHPSLLAELQRLIGNWGYVVWAFLFIFVLYILYKMWMRENSVTAMIWSLALTTLVTPYVWSWDFVLLLPLFGFSFSKTNWKGKVFLFITYLAACVGMTLIQVSENNNNYRFWWVPLCFIGTVSLVSYWDASKQTNE